MTDAPMTARTGPKDAANAATSAATAGEVLSGFLTAQAGAFLRALPQAVGEAGSRPGALPAGTAGAVAAAGTEDLLRSVRRIGGALHTFGAAFEPGWAEETRTELRWLLNLLAQEPAYLRRSARLLAALDSLSETDPDGPGMLAGHSGAPKARALLERQLTLARTRAHTALLQELRSARLHALADRMTLLASDVPLLAGGSSALLPQAAAALAALAAGAQLLPLGRAATPYGGKGLHRLAAVPPARGAEPVRAAAGPAAEVEADAALAADDAPWHRVRILVKRARYALEVCGSPAEEIGELDALDRTLDRHQEAADAAVTVATAARTPRITPATAYVLGVVHADQRLEVEAARYAFGHQWPNLPHHGWHEWATA
ncbi:CHAD domain-containing protein [Kitasatospora atroaurantiaca]|uniref:CHAD domain-containing protein n=1 Tax=Kitasatospora atroaurantiaca TaxID=285545 RepID=A0A561ETJ4_9ACTN|nr:CHAD domain-containing protein [Kitasatospora atroaurantiaca]TWE18917.1 CHAD domain-containing protein [Kitasatospora atroaurantiaca]